MNLILALLSFVFASLAEGQDLRKPHIIFIFADDMGWNDVSFHGSLQIPTPNIDALAFTGTVLHNYYALPLCTPSRSALMTGKHPIRLGMQNEVVEFTKKYGLPLSEKLLPQYLKELGYSTNIVGKWHLGHYRKAYTPTYRGFDNFYGYYLGRHDYYDQTASQTVFNRTWNSYDMRRNLETDWSVVGNYTTTLFTNEAENVIHHHNSSTGPLFLYLAHLAPHAGNPNDPLQAPPETVVLFDHIKDPKRRIYAAMMHELDESVGKVVRALKEKNMLENSIIVFSGDNGGAASGMDGNIASNWPLRGAKNMTWEGGIRTTGLIWSPLLPADRRGTVVKDLFDLTDWLPTLLEAAGGNQSYLDGIDGVSQWKTIFSGTASTRVHLLHNIDDVYGFAAVRQGKYKLVKASIANGYLGKWDDWFGPTGRENVTKDTFDKYEQKLRNSDAGKVLSGMDIKLPTNLQEIINQFEINCGEIRPIDAIPCIPLEDPYCLYDMENDPCEYHNLAGRQPGLVQELKSLLQWYNSSAVPAWNPLFPSDPNADPIYWNCTATYWDDLVFEPTNALDMCPKNNGLILSSYLLLHAMSMVMILWIDIIYY